MDYSVAIIGAGKMGAGYDSPDSKDILSHAHAFTANLQTKLIGIVDTDARQGTREAARWSTSYYPTLAELLKTGTPDIIVIATPDSTHATILEEALSAKPKLIICEKPIASKLRDANTIRDLTAASTIPIVVNFSRRFDTRMVELKKELEPLRIISAHVRYGKGVHHIGSHLFDLLRYFFGDMTACQARSKIEDYPEDPSYGGSASFERCPAVDIEIVDSRRESVFDIEIVSDKARFRLFELGHKLETPKGVDQTGLSNAAVKLVEHALAVIEGKEKPIVTVEDALKTFDACEQFAHSYQEL